jgi:DNA invertase Pin-like site-specific DNA recombinase
MTRAAVWLRVSDAGQHAENQLPDLEAWAQRHGLEVVQVYQLQESAWRGGHQKVLTQVYRDARRSKFQVLLVWALDRCPGKGLWLPWRSYTDWADAGCRFGRTRSPGPRPAGNCWICSWPSPAGSL